MTQADSSALCDFLIMLRCLDHDQQLVGLGLQWKRSNVRLYISSVQTKFYYFFKTMVKCFFLVAKLQKEKWSASCVMQRIWNWNKKHCSTNSWKNSTNTGFPNSLSLTLTQLICCWNVKMLQILYTLSVGRPFKLSVAHFSLDNFNILCLWLNWYSANKWPDLSFSFKTGAHTGGDLDNSEQYHFCPRGSTINTKQEFLRFVTLVMNLAKIFHQSQF